MAIYRIWADLIVVFHAAYASFVVGAMVAILIGIAFRWHWVRNFWFRFVHLIMIGIVVGESLCGVSCPLTTWENELREKAGDGAYPASFIGYWVHRFLFYDVPATVWTWVYCAFGAAVLATIFLAPPRWPWPNRRERIVPSVKGETMDRH